MNTNRKTKQARAMGGWWTGQPPDPQIPIDGHVATMVTLIACDRNGCPRGIVGYMLGLGADVPAQELTTKKGRIAIAPATELWFSTSRYAAQVNLDGVAQLRWSVQTLAAESTATGILQQLIDNATGLVNVRGWLTPAAIGPAGSVQWTADKLAHNLYSFEYYDAFAQRSWQLSIAQDQMLIRRLAWSTDDGDALHRNTRLPDLFGTTPGLVMTAKNNPQYTAVYDRYVYS